ncbi:MAG: NAD(P)-dependent alcohol dehydrogenase [Cytophagales bacterium]|nr:MAG: NAD(P)-dependent alcohol dehydrogenase [Cytophagales bacterium]
MKAVIYTTYGPPSVLQLTDIAKPVPDHNEVLVRVSASTVTSGTLWLRKGAFPGSTLFTVLLRLMFGITRPRKPVLGVEFSGTVEAVGDSVAQFRPGDVVYGTTTGLRQGAYAQYVCVPETWREGVLAVKPTELTFQEAAALPVGSMTALHILQKAAIQQGQEVLIYGASGSVGTYAVQLATYFGGRVTAACSPANFAMVQSIGANAVVDYAQPDLSNWENRFDVVFDAVGKLPSSLGKQLVKKGGHFLSVKSVTSEKVEYLRSIHQIIAEGRLKPVIDRTYPLDEIVDAHAYVELGHKKGNVVVTVLNS